MDRAKHKKVSDLHNRVFLCKKCIENGSSIIFEDKEKVRRLINPRSLDSEIMIILQAPAADQVRLSGVFFHNKNGIIGVGGSYINKYLNQIGYTIDPLQNQYRLVYTTDAIHCFPGKSKKGNGDISPNRAEIKTCWHYLEQEIEIINPKVIIAFGKSSSSILFNMITNERLENLSDIMGKSKKWSVGKTKMDIFFLPHPTSMVANKSNIFFNSFNLVLEVLQ